jgi:hypothetical protein
MSRLSRAAAHCRPPTVEGRRSTRFFIHPESDIRTVRNYTDSTRSETLSILSHRWVSKIFNKYSESSTMCETMLLRSQRGVIKMSRLSFTSFAKIRNFQKFRIFWQKNSNFRFAKTVQAFFTRKSPYLFWFRINFRKNNIKNLQKNSYFALKLSYNLPNSRVIKTFSQKWSHFSHVGDKVLPFCKKVKESQQLLIFIIFLYFWKEFARKCENDFRKNAKSNIFVST